LLIVESNLKQVFGKVLRELRLEKGISQQELADNCDIERAYISRLERGLFQPSITIVFKISDYFGMKPAEIVEKVDKQRKKVR
jgi:transcriptional regulator with XRE-family HTH domain